MKAMKVGMCCAFVVVAAACANGPGQETDAGAAPEQEIEGDPCGAIPTFTTEYESPSADTGDVGDRLIDFSLDDCDGNPWKMSDAVRSAELTLINVGAGWCRPCREETEVLEEQVHAHFCGRGLRVVQVLYQDNNVTPATPTFCRGWREEFELEFPVLIDPAFTRSRWFEDELAQTPLNLLVDAEGRVLERFVGDSGIDVLIDAIENHLPPAQE